MLEFNKNIVETHHELMEKFDKIVKKYKSNIELSNSKCAEVKETKKEEREKKSKERQSN